MHGCQPKPHTSCLCCVVSSDLSSSPAFVPSTGWRRRSSRSAEGSIHSNIIETALTTLQPIRDLAKNWDIDIAGWCVASVDSTVCAVVPRDCVALLARLLLYFFSLQWERDERERRMNHAAFATYRLSFQVLWTALMRSLFILLLLLLLLLLTLLYFWSVLLVGSLDEYLEDLELTQETRQQVKAATLNFAQAALVLQNSSGIYSRKVDYLHSHVYKVQEELSLNELLGGAKAGNKKGGRGGNKTGIDAQVEEFLNFDPHLEFLLLDDVLPTDTTDECHKINLAQESSTGSALAGTAATDQSVLTTGTRLSMGSALNRRLSLGSSVGTGTTSGMAMMDQTGFTTNNGNGKPNLAAAQRAFLGTAQDTGSLRLTGGSCDIGEEGVLFLPGSQEQTTYSSQEEPISTHATSGSNPMDFNNDGDDDFGGGGGAFDDGMDDNDDDGGAAFVMADNDQNDDAAAQQKKRVTFADSTAAAAPKIHKPVPVVDPWALLDRDTPDSKKARPLRVGKTIVLPDSVDALPSECVTGSRTRRVARKQQRERVLRRAKTAPSSLAAQTFQQVMTTTTNTLLGQKRALEDTTQQQCDSDDGSCPAEGLSLRQRICLHCQGDGQTQGRGTPRPAQATAAGCGGSRSGA